MVDVLRDTLPEVVGPWSEADFLSLSSERRVELLDGDVLVNPSPGRPHQRLSWRLCAALDALAPPGFEVLEAVNVRLGADRLLIPDLVVTTDPGAEDLVADASVVALAVEIVNPGSRSMDGAVKPGLYAAAGIPTFVRIEDPRSPTVVVGELVDGRYRPVRAAGAAGVLRLGQPFRAVVDLTELTGPRRSARVREGG